MLNVIVILAGLVLVQVGLWSPHDAIGYPCGILGICLVTGCFLRWDETTQARSDTIATERKNDV